MHEHLKERLTGAAILVIVVVLLVPELFRGPPNTSLKTGTSATTGPPIRSYTIDLRDPATTQLPSASVPALAVPAPAVANAPPSAPTGAPPVAEAASAPLSAPPLIAAQPLAGAPAAPKPTATLASSHAGAVKSGWTVQVGSFARRDYAERMAKQVAAKGYAVEVAGPDDHGLYRVRSTPQSARAAAVALKQKMQASGLKPIVNTVP